MIADRSMVGDSNFCRCFTLTIVLSTSVSSSTLQSWSLIRNEIAIEVRIDRFNKLTCFNVIGDLERCNGLVALRTGIIINKLNMAYEVDEIH
ncbi:unnamed protein product, partial [Rotaria sp. Silwood1]